jgi:hypothetical protein
MIRRQGRIKPTQLLAGGFFYLMFLITVFTVN